MELINVYRVETETGAGPYIGAHVSLTHGIGSLPSEVWKNHPGPDTDMALMQGPPTEEQVDTADWDAYNGEPSWYSEEGQHPTIGIRHDERCGFWSLAQLRQWFDIENNLDVLDRAGHSISVYKVPADKIRYGVRQVVFNYSVARFVERFEFSGMVADW